MAAAAAVLCTSTMATTAWADTTEIPAGLACPGFALGIESSGGRLTTHTFTDRAGNEVGSITAGTGPALTFSNPDADTVYQTSSNGTVTRIRVNSDGTQTWVTTGHNVLILFPTDVPAGPSTTLYVGRVEFTVDVNGVFTVVSTTGRSVDICAALGG